MKTNELNKLVEFNLNPPVIFKIVLNHTIEEIEQFKEKFATIITDDEGAEYKFKCVIVDINEYVSYIFTDKDYLVKLKNLFNRTGIDFTLTNASRELFELTNIDEILSSLEEDDDISYTEEFFPGYSFPRNKATEIIKSVFESTFTIDDVLDRINMLGLASLNNFHKHLLG